MLISKSSFFQNRHRGAKQVKRGQSLVEFALTLPVLLVILAGTVEVGNVLAVYNRVQTAAREGARFGAMGGDNIEVWNVVDQASKQSLVESDDRMMVWVIRPTLHIDSSGVWSWEGAGASPASPWGPESVPPLPTIECVFPDDCTTIDAASIPLTANKVLNEMQWANNTYKGLDGDRFVIAVVSYETDLLLNLPWFTRSGGRFPMWAYAVMRVEVAEQAIVEKKEGCTAFPLALNFYQLPNLDDTKRGEYIPPKNPDGTYSPDLKINDPAAGAAESQGIGYTAWNTDYDEGPDLHDNSQICGDMDLPEAGCPFFNGAMQWPGNSAHLPHGYINPLGPLSPLDTKMNKTDWVLASKANSLSSQAIAILQEHRDKVRTLPIIVYKYVPPGGSDANPLHALTTTTGEMAYMYQIYRFATVQIAEAETAIGSGGNWVVLKWVDWLDTCGQ